ncbi:MAG: heat-inducible transcriptional repressor HrcA [Alphaproteobacteria bacterium]|nr:heat-inducible transcriptional repressor HrcA [Alphaproteobacteria bacterium]TAD91991.1 MAG: heat-inducible transcriptional repressor HrcA [Alphaproteobacteria bacterium]
MIPELNERSREIFRHLVEAFMESGEPVGSRTLSRRLSQHLSPATIRNVMADLVDAGLLEQPHTSAGRVPTDRGLRLFVDGLLEIGALSEGERKAIEAECAASGRSFGQMLEAATSALSGLTGCAGVVMAPRLESSLKHIEFVPLAPGRALVVLVTENGEVENRLVELPPGIPAASLVSAGNFLTARLSGRTLAEARADVMVEIAQERAEIDALASKVVAAGLATWTTVGGEGTLIVRGQSNLLDDVTAVADLERIRALFQALEARETMLRLLDATSTGEGIRIFIGAENPLFTNAGASVIIAPFTNARERVVGAIGVIGPTRLNYARIIPMVDYTAKVIGRLLR